MEEEKQQSMTFVLYDKAMRRIILIAIALTVICSENGYAQNVIDAITYTQQNDMSDPYHRSAVMQRCAGVYMGYAKFLPTDMQKNKKKFAAIAQKFFIESGTELRKKRMTSDSENLKQISSAFLFFTDHYYNKIEKTQLATGSIFSGKVLEEFKFCGQFFKK